MKTKNIKVRDHDGDVTKVSFAPVPPVGSGKHCKPKIRRLVQKSGAAVLSLPVLARMYPPMNGYTVEDARRSANARRR